jgi:endo-1,3-1,4-beta-glycanase ExoK
MPLPRCAVPVPSADIPQEMRTTIRAQQLGLTLDNERRCMIRIGIPTLGFLATVGLPNIALAVTSGEIYPAAGYGYGRYETRLRFAAGDGVVSSFFLWKDGSEKSGVFWNELDFEKVGADCHVETNAIYGNPPANHSQRHEVADACGTYHTYTYEWTPEAIVWLIDNVEVRRETGATAAAYAQNAQAMQIRFNVWPGDASFGGNFSPNILPVHQYVDWVQFSSYAAGAFTVQWRQDFNAQTVPTDWLTANWQSPKMLSTHSPANINFMDGYLVISLTADNATGPAGAMPGDGKASGGAPSTGGGGSGGRGGNAGSGGTGGAAGGAGGSGVGGTPASGGSASPAGGAATGGATSSGGMTGSGGALATGGMATSTGGSGLGGTAGSASVPTSSGSPGASATGGAAPLATGGSAGAFNPPPSPPPSDQGGCSVNARHGRDSSGLLAVLFAALLLPLRRRRRNFPKKREPTS